MRTAVLRPPVMDLPPPSDALVLRVVLTRPPQQTRRVRLVAVEFVVRVARVVARWLRAVVLIPHGRFLDVLRARGPPD